LENNPQTKHRFRAGCFTLRTAAAVKTSAATAARALALALCLPHLTCAQEAADPVPAATLSARYGEWTALAPGFELRAFRASRPSRASDELIVVARIDPRLYELALTLSAAKGKQRHTARDWAQREGLVAAINAGMFRADVAGLPVGFTRADGVTLNPVLTSDGAALAFGAILDPGNHGASDSAARILDRSCDHFDGAALSAYANALQSIRMISCDGRNVWTEQAREWSMAAIATDTDGRVLFIHVRSPYSVHTFAEMLMAASLGVKRAMYLEGGPEATLFVHVGEVLVERVGSYETGFHESDDNVAAWPLPMSSAYVGGRVASSKRRATADELQARLTCSRGSCPISRPIFLRSPAQRRKGALRAVSRGSGGRGAPWSS
jgi:uncharacterized protein YigE (DUF2233 family)